MALVLTTNGHEWTRSCSRGRRPRQWVRTANIPIKIATTIAKFKKILRRGKIHPDISVPFREITLAPTKSVNGEIEINEPVRVYDTSGPWGDPDFHGDVTQGLPPLRAKWIQERGDVEEIDGRKVQPIDDGWLSEVHARERRTGTTPTPKDRTFNVQRSMEIPAQPSRRKPLRARAGHRVTQLWYARQGIITPEMEFIAIRENLERGLPARSLTADRMSALRWDEMPATLCSNNTAANRLARNIPERNHSQSLCGAKSPAAAPSFPQTSIIPNPSR